INYRDQDFVDVTKNQTNGVGVNVILDMVGGNYIQRNFSAAARDGRIVNIAFLNGSKSTVDFTPVMIKRLTLTGSTLRSQSSEVKVKITQELRQEVWPLLNAQKIKPVIDSIFPLSDVAKAHERMESGEHIGKIILEIK
ncbi:MAG: NAD(P)H-quinone oxidoreductase, partial [Moraxellaceae bacterium]